MEFKIDRTRFIYKFFVKSLPTLLVLAGGLWLGGVWGSKTINQLTGVQRGKNISFPISISTVTQLLIMAGGIALFVYIFELREQHKKRSSFFNFMLIVCLFVQFYDAYSNVNRIWMANSPASESSEVHKSIFEGLFPPQQIWEDKMGKELTKLHDGSFVYATPIQHFNKEGVVDGETYTEVPATNAFLVTLEFGERILYAFPKVLAFLESIFIAIYVAMLPAICIAFLISTWVNIRLLEPRLKEGSIKELLEGSYSKYTARKLADAIAPIMLRADQDTVIEWFLGSNEIDQNEVTEILGRIHTVDDIPTIISFKSRLAVVPEQTMSALYEEA